MNNPQSRKNSHLLLQYAGLAMQLLVALSLAVYVGKWGDTHWFPHQPLLIWLLPLLLLLGMMVKIIRDTAKK